VIVDDYSRYTWVYFFKHKYETQQTVGDFTNEVQRQYGQDILMIRSVGDITLGIPKYPCLYDLYMLYE
jgi:hypothetical protein